MTRPPDHEHHHFDPEEDAFDKEIDRMITEAYLYPLPAIGFDEVLMESGRLPLLGFGPIDEDSLRFMQVLRENRERILSQLEQFHQTTPTNPEAVLPKLFVGRYLDTTLKAHIFGMNPYPNPANMDDSVNEEWEYQTSIATMAIAKTWHVSHPDSSTAGIIAKHGIMPPTGAQVAFLREVWPLVNPILHVVAADQ